MILIIVRKKKNAGKVKEKDIRWTNDDEALEEVKNVDELGTLIDSQTRVRVRVRVKTKES